MAEKKQISFKGSGGAGIRAGSKSSMADILRLLGELNADSSPTLSQVESPLADSAMCVLADLYESRGEVGKANLYRGMVAYQHLNVPAKGGKRVKDLLEAAVAVMRQEFEVAKASAKRALP